MTDPIKTPSYHTYIEGGWGRDNNLFTPFLHNICAQEGIRVLLASQLHERYWYREFTREILASLVALHSFFRPF